MPAVMGDGLKPFTVKYTPSENSNSATGSVAIAGSADTFHYVEQHGSIGNEEQRRSDECEHGKNPRHQPRLVQQMPSKRSFTAGMRLCDRRKIRSYRATSAWPVTNAPFPAPPSHKVTIVRRHATPARMPAASRTREPAAERYRLSKRQGECNSRAFTLNGASTPSRLWT